MKDPIEVLAKSLEHVPPSFDWIVEHASDEAAFVRTWRKSMDMDAKVKIVTLIELREVSTMRRAVAALLGVAAKSPHGRSKAESKWAAGARGLLGVYVDGHGIAKEASNMLLDAAATETRPAPGTDAYLDALMGVERGDPDDLRRAFRAATEHGSKRFALAMKQLDAVAPTLAQVLEACR